MLAPCRDIAIPLTQRQKGASRPLPRILTEENMRNWFRLFVVGAATPVLLKTRRNERLPMAIANGKSTIRSFLVATPLLAVSCTSVMVQTPQQMSDYAINIAKVDPTTDPKPQTLASDQVACANKARLQYPIGVDEAAIMTGNIVGGAARWCGFWRCRLCRDRQRGSSHCSRRRRRGRPRRAEWYGSSKTNLRNADASTSDS